MDSEQKMAYGRVGQVGVSLSGSPIKQSEITQELGRLNSAVEALNKVSSVLSGRLEHVLRPAAPQAESDKVAESPHTKVANGIYQNRTGVEVVICRLESILSRLEL